MASVDNRVVKMEFDNASFERKLETTIASLGKLEKALQLDGAKKGLSDVSAEASKFHMGGMGSAIEGVSKGFLALSTIAITALANITTAAMHAGTAIAKALFGPVMDGFREYETNLNSIQTILANTASKGTSMDQVTGALDKLNAYSDKTIYNFGQMAKNIGTFTAAGVNLDSSVNAIKGIANLAAMSGSTSEQASSAMYQMSQAMASGTLKAQDWISVVNSGIGGQVFQSSLYETAKALGTLKDVPMDQSFEAWKESGGNFKDAMAEGVFTADVLGLTLEAFTGDLTDAQLAEKGFTEAQIANIQATAKVAQSAATEVKTFTQLVGTVKEAVGTGWADSFKIIIGNFEEAKALWTGVNSSIGKFVSANAEARNHLLQGWKDLGGRALLIESLGTAISNFGKILAPIKTAFREIVPPATAENLMHLTNAFSSFAKALEPSTQTVENLRRIFKGLFSALQIGWEVLKQTALFIGDLFKSITGAGSGGFLEFAAKIGDFFTSLNDKLVEGRGIIDFFTKIREIVKDVTPYIQFAKDTIVDFVKSLSSGGMDAFSGAMERAGQRFQTLKDILGKAQEMWGPFKEGLMKIMDVLEEVWGAIKRWFSELGAKIAGAMGPGDFQATLDALNVGLLGGIAALLAKFIKDGFSFDIGGGMFDKIGQSFEQLTGVLSAMQTEIKADALLKIAGAIAILTASVLVLSMIDSAALTVALAAMAVGFGQLMASFALINKMASGPKGAATFDMIATGMILLSTSILILSAAVRTLSDLDPDELATGLAGVAGMLTIMTTAALILSNNSSGLVGAGIGMMGIATSLAILAGVVKLFSMMSLTDIATGLGSVAVALLIIAGAMQLMPNGVSMALQGAGLLMITTSLAILAGVMQTFAGMSWTEIGKGMAAVAGGLLIIAGAMQLMPPTMPIIGVGLLLVSVSLIAIAKAMEMMGGLSWSEIGKGLATMAASLLILAVATSAMTGSIPGAIAIGIVSASLMLLAKVLQTFADISFGDLLHGLIGMAAVLAAIGIAAMLLQPAIPAMLALGAALVLIGAGFALFGLGASMVATAFELIARVGKTGSEAFVVALKNMGKAIPALASGVAEGIIEILTILLKFAPVLIKALVEIVGHLLEGLGKLIPQVVNIVGILITSLLQYIVTIYPQIIAAGIALIMALLEGIRSAIGPIVVVVGEIIVNFLNALSLELPRIIEAGVNLLVQLIKGITDSMSKIADAITSLITTFLAELVTHELEILAAGTALLVMFLKGISDEIQKVIDAAADIIVKFIQGISDNLFKLAAAATDVVVKFCEEVGNNVQKVVDAGGNLIIKLIEGFGKKGVEVARAGKDAVLKFLEGISQNSIELANGASKVITDFLHALATAIRNNSAAFRSAGWDIATAIVDGMTGGMASKAQGLANKAVDVAKGAFNAAKNFLGISSPSKLFMTIGENMAIGLAVGMDQDVTAENSAVSLVDRTTQVFANSLSKITESLGDMTEFNPTITPVLDLTKISQDAQKIGDYIQTSQKLSPDYSFSQARTIAATANAQQDEKVKAPAGSGEVTFNQTINAPTQLTTSEIYKNTRNQITMAKQELSIP